MDMMIIEGGRPLRGKVRLSGAKNAALPIMAATILAEDTCSLGNIPQLADVDTLAELLQRLGLAVYRTKEGRTNCRVVSRDPCTAPFELVSKIRGSFDVLGPLLASRGYAKVSLPGGCVIGTRPIDLHLKGFRALGAEVSLEEGYVIVRAPGRGGRPNGLKGAHIYIAGPMGSSVGATKNLMLAATLAEGTTVLEHCACEPEVEDLARFLIALGARIEGAGTHRLIIHGVEALAGGNYDIIPDRIEAGTFAAAAAITQGDIILEGARREHLFAVIDLLEEMGAAVRDVPGGLRVSLSGRPRPARITTLPFPGFPTDMQAQFTAVLALASGASTITERVYPDRFMHVAELARLGAQIDRFQELVVVHGVGKLSGAPVTASDLRASAALVLAGLAAEGRTCVRRIYHLDRGYEKLEEKLTGLGAALYREDEAKLTQDQRRDAA